MKFFSNVQTYFFSLSFILLLHSASFAQNAIYNAKIPSGEAEKMSDLGDTTEKAMINGRTYKIFPCDWSFGPSDQHNVVKDSNQKKLFIMDSNRDLLAKFDKSSQKKCTYEDSTSGIYVGSFDFSFKNGKYDATCEQTTVESGTRLHMIVRKTCYQRKVPDTKAGCDFDHSSKTDKTIITFNFSEGTHSYEYFTSENLSSLGLGSHPSYKKCVFKMK